MLVEDYDSLREDMTELLEDMFLEVLVAKNGREAFDLYQGYKNKHNKYPDIIMTDIQMPIMNGVELCEAVRNISKDQHIIVLSAHTDAMVPLSSASTCDMARPRIATAIKASLAFEASAVTLNPSLSRIEIILFLE